MTTKPSKYSRRAASNVVLVDDEDAFRESLKLNLIDEGFRVVDFPRGAEALDYLSRGQRVDLVLLDWKMPGMGGLEVLHRMQEQRIEVPVIFLTVLGDQLYEEAALSRGAVDYVGKSRSFGILLKRMRLILGGSKCVEPQHAESDARVIRVGPLSLDTTTKSAVWRGAAVPLTVREFGVVALLADRAGQNVSYRQIYDTVRRVGFHAGYGAEGYRAAVRSLIKRVRQKFRDADPTFEALENYHGFGYRWRRDH